MTKEKNNTNSIRIHKLLSFPDLSRIKNSPIKFIVDKILSMPAFKDFDIIETPEIVSVEYNFDLLNTPPDHPSRRETDTYYIDKDHVLRTHTTVMWPFYLLDKKNIEKLKRNGFLACLCYGKVFRKDEIDRNHFPVFHQIDGLYIADKKIKVIELGDLKKVLIDIAKSIYGDKVEYKILVDSFPFTDPSAQLEIKRGEDWLEVVGCGLVHKQVLKNFGLDPDVYNGWAFGFGIERLAMVKMNIPDIRIFWSTDKRITSQFKNLDSQYKEMSKFPMTSRDISFVIDKNISLNNYYEIVRDFAENLIEEVKLIDKYEDEKKFGEDKISYTFRIIYRSPERTLTNEEVNKIQEKIREKTEQELGALLR
jgi:phenylalanyl-tRNA synthetase alpha chain